MPGTNIRYGIDGLIGLIPVIGDIITSAISPWLVREARALGAPWYITARMVGNVAVDGLVGMVPFVGDAFDVMFRANMRNSLAPLAGQAGAVLEARAAVLHHTSVHPLPLLWEGNSSQRIRCKLLCPLPLWERAAPPSAASSPG